MDTEKVKTLSELLTTYKQLRDNGSVEQISFLVGERIYGVKNNTDIIIALLDEMIVVIERLLDIARFGGPSELLQNSREYKIAMELAKAVNNYSFNPDRFAESIPYMHRTLQQNIFRLIRSCICYMAQADSGRIDDRNRASHEMCKALVDIAKKYSLPYI